jgi:hypothetical protein
VSRKSPARKADDEFLWVAARGNEGPFNTGNHNTGIGLTGDNLVGIGPFSITG